MSVLKIYCNQHGDIIGDIRDKEGIKRIYYTKIPTVLNILIDEGVVDRKLEGENLVINHTNNQVIIENAANLLSFSEIMKYDQKVTEILREKSYKKIEEAKKARKKVQRKSYIKGIAVVVAATTLALSILATAYMKKTKGKPTPQPTIEPSTTMTYVEKDQTDLTEYTLTTEPETQNSTQIIEPPSQEIKDKKNYTIDLDLEDRTNDEKYINTKRKYGEIITKYANEYGLDPNLVLAIATQERGEHSDVIDPGGGIGLMQVQYGVWIGKSISAYNVRLGEFETENITDEKLRDLETNIKIGTMILRNYLEKVNYNLAGGIFGYNKGITSVLGVMGNSINNAGEFESWVDKLVLSNGDDFYLWNVASYMCGKKITIITDEGEELVFKIINTAHQKVLV